MPSDMYTFPDGGPRYGIRTDKPAVSVPAPAVPLFGKAVRQAALIDCVQLDFIGRFPQAPDNRADFRKLRDAHPAELAEAKAHVKSVLGSPARWLRRAEELVDASFYQSVDEGRAVRALVMTLVSMTAYLAPLAVAFACLAHGEAVLAAAGGYFISALVLFPVVKASRRNLARDGLYMKRIVRGEMGWIWDDLVRASFAELLHDRCAGVSAELLQEAGSAWKHHVHVADRVADIRTGPTG